MLYTIIPLEKIYETKIKQKTTDEDLETKEISIKNGMLSLRLEKDHYVVEKVWSTDMSDYLNADYFPGTKMNL